MTREIVAMAVVWGPKLQDFSKRIYTGLFSRESRLQAWEECVSNASRDTGYCQSQIRKGRGTLVIAILLPTISTLLLAWRGKTCMEKVKRW